MKTNMLVGSLPGDVPFTHLQVFYHLFKKDDVGMLGVTVKITLQTGDMTVSYYISVVM